jgi:phosphate transport system ATP-binding protein
VVIQAYSDSIPPEVRPEKLRTEGLSAYFGAARVLRSVSVPVALGSVTAIIGPSGAGKSTFLRCLNRMHELTIGARVEGRVLIDGADIYAPGVLPSSVRRRIGSLVQRPSPFPTMSIRDNVLAGLTLNGIDDDAFGTVERALRQVDLWESQKAHLDDSPMGLSRGDQQRLCLARALALSPEVLLMDEPCVLLDPKATTTLEELIHELKSQYPIVIATHSVQQAARVSDYTAFLYEGDLVEYNESDVVFTRPKDRRTEDYITGRFG